MLLPMSTIDGMDANPWLLEIPDSNPRMDRGTGTGSSTSSFVWPPSPISTDAGSIRHVESRATDAASDKARLFTVLEAATGASEVVRSIDTIFDELIRTISSINSKYPKETNSYLSGLEELRKEFRRIVTDSTRLAVEIANYTSRLNMMTELAFDATLLRETQCRALNSYIENGRGFEEGARDIENRFKDFEESFRGLVLSFNEWAKESESKLKKRCQDVDKMEVGHHVTLIWATATVVLYAAAAIYYPQACFYVGMVGGMGTLGADEARRASEAIISIQTTREILFRTGTEKHQKLKQDMCFLSKVWQTAHNDATELVRCLEGGTSMIDMPKYLQRSAEGATSFYKKMANYLRVYADGIQAVHLPTLSSPQSDKQ